MPAYEITVSAPFENEAQPRTAKLRVAGPYDKERAKVEALRLAKELPALKGTDFSKAVAVITTRMAVDVFVASRRTKSVG